MPDRENIISDFEHEVFKADSEGWDFVDLTTEDAKEILSLLKEQETVHVSQYWDGAYGDYVNACECGNHWISIVGSLVNYCPGCGKKVQWSA